jgi:hypothetical protein
MSTNNPIPKPNKKPQGGIPTLPPDFDLSQSSGVVFEDEAPRTPKPAQAVPPKAQVPTPAVQSVQAKAPAPADKVKTPAIPDKPQRRFTKQAIGKQKGQDLDTFRFGANLLPEDTEKKVAQLLPSKFRKFIFSILLLLVLFSSVWGGLSWLKLKVFTKVQQINGDIQRVQLEVLEYEKDANDIKKLQDRYVVIKDLLDNHIYWTSFFARLEQYTRADVYYTSFAVQSIEGGQITLAAKAKNVEAVAKQIKLLQSAEDFAQEVNVNGISVQTLVEQRGDVPAMEVVDFNIHIKLAEGVFSK